MREFKLSEQNNVSQAIVVQNQTIGYDHPVWIVAELSANHGGRLELAVETVRAAKRAGANAIKIQTYTADTMTLPLDREHFRIQQGTIWDGAHLYDLYAQASLPWEWHKTLQDVATEEGLIFFSTPFDRSAVDFLEKLHVPIYKIASFEINDSELIRCVAKTGKPIIFSSGIAAPEDIDEALRICRELGNNQVVVLKCTSAYPATLSEAHLNNLKYFQERWGVLTGISDHTPGFVVPMMATGLGACVIEKHFILDKALGGPDASFSLDPQEFSEMVRRVREAESCLGLLEYTLSDRAKKNRFFCRSLYVVADMKCGEPFTDKNIRSLRPAVGLAPHYYSKVLGRVASSDIVAGTPLRWDVVKGGNPLC